MAEDRYLCISSGPRIHGIHLSKLDPKVADVKWEKVTSLLFDFSIDDLPLPEHRIGLHIFDLDSRVFAIPRDAVFYANKEIPSGPGFKFYEIDINNKKVIDASSIPPIPSPYAPCFVGNISGKIYMLIYIGINKVGSEGLWVLSDDHDCWIPLESPPPVVDQRSELHHYTAFVTGDKLFFHGWEFNDRHGYYGEGAPSFMYSFDPITGKWVTEGANLLKSYLLHPLHWFGSYCFPFVTLESLSGLKPNCSVALSSSLLLDPDPPMRYDEDNENLQVNLYAFLLNQDGAVIVYQLLSECLEGMEFFHFFGSTPKLTFVDLGNHMLCALYNGPIKGQDGYCYCASVFTLALAEPNVDFDTGADPKEQRFLSVRVHEKLIFPMVDPDYELMEAAFVFPPKKKKDSAISNQRKRKSLPL